MKEDVSNRAAQHFTIICAHGDGIFSQTLKNHLWWLQAGGFLWGSDDMRIFSQTFSINSGRGFKSAVHSKKSMPGDSQGAS